MIEAERAALKACGFCNHADYNKIRNQKFTELIVKECIDIMERNFAGGQRTTNQNYGWEKSVATFVAWNNGIKTSREKIKQHFGIDS